MAVIAAASVVAVKLTPPHPLVAAVPDVDTPLPRIKLPHVINDAHEVAVRGDVP